MAVTDELLVVDDVVNAFGGSDCCQPCHAWRFEKNTIHSVIGPNGAGKTTFFNVLSGFYKPQSGSIRFKNQELIGLKPDEICRLGMARTFQKIRLFSTMSAMENIMLACDSEMRANPFEVCCTHTKNDGRRKSHAPVFLGTAGLRGFGG